MRNAKLVGSLRHLRVPFSPSHYFVMLTIQQAAQESWWRMYEHQLVI